MKMSDVMQQAAAGQESSEPNSANQDDGRVVDADFEEIDDSKK
jgi:hypothetical protein